jgi:hypothetical protein
MHAGINNVIYMELHLGPKMVNGTCGKTIVAGTIDRGFTVYMPPPPQLPPPVRLYMNFKLAFFEQNLPCCPLHLNLLICIISTMCNKKTKIYDDSVSASAYITLEIA